MYDPYGYYSMRSYYSVNKDPNIPFYEDFPVGDHMWFIGSSYKNLGKLQVPDPVLESNVSGVYELDDETAKALKKEEKDVGSHGH